MLYPYIGVQAATIFMEDRTDRIIIETKEATRATRLFLNGIPMNCVYTSPIAAYVDTVRILDLLGHDVEFDIDIAINVAPLDAIEQAYQQAGVNVTNVNPT